MTEEATWMSDGGLERERGQQGSVRMVLNVKRTAGISNGSVGRERRQ